MNNTVILINNDGMGQADKSLQYNLLNKYLQLIQQNDSLPKAICFYTNGVKLVVDGSPLLDQLSEIESRGVLLIVCGTCLDYFNLLDQLKVGIVGGMPDIIEAQIKAEKVITL